MRHTNRVYVTLPLNVHRPTNEIPAQHCTRISTAAIPNRRNECRIPIHSGVCALDFPFSLSISTPPGIRLEKIGSRAKTSFVCSVTGCLLHIGDVHATSDSTCHRRRPQRERNGKYGAGEMPFSGISTCEYSHKHGCDRDEAIGSGSTVGYTVKAHRFSPFPYVRTKCWPIDNKTEQWLWVWGIANGFLLFLGPTSSRVDRH